MFVDDPEKKVLGDIYRANFAMYRQMPEPQYAEGDTRGDGEKQAAELLGIPFDKYSQGGLFPIGYTKGTDFRPAKRLPAERVTHWNSW